jgi:UDP-glucose:(heptosyl)LPS alpha-1,3-glucosyltransferase
MKQEQGFEGGRSLTVPAEVGSAEQRRDPASCRVALVYTACHRRGGVERVVVESANHLAGSGCSTTVLASRFGDAGDLDARVTRDFVSGGRLPLGFGLSRFQHAVSERLGESNFDVIGGFGVQSPPGSVVWVQSVHAAWWEQCRKRRRGWTRWVQQANPFHRIVLRLEHQMFRERRYRRLVALTPAVQRDLENFYGVPAADVEVLPNGYREAEFHVGLKDRFREEVRRRLSIPPDAWVLLFVANEWERKGLLPLLEALRRWRKPDVHLVAAGRLPKHRLTCIASKFGLGDRFHCVGSREPVNTWFGMADAFVLPTHYEAWGMVIIEALASGLPVLTSATAGAAVAIQSRINGIVLEDPSSTSEILSGLVRLRRCILSDAQTISDSAKPYEWSRLLSRYEQILRSTR